MKAKVSAVVPERGSLEAKNVAVCWDKLGDWAGTPQEVCPHKRNVAATKHRYSITTMIPIIAKQAKSMYLKLAVWKSAVNLCLRNNQTIKII